MWNWLSQQQWLGDTANIIQLVSSLAVISILLHYWENRCKHCWRHGSVPVPGEHHKICKHHARKLRVTHG